ncbi:glycoside hydrolase family 1 protein [Frankia sp. CNm7]|uniref:Glycoside hydrolase family 1 protein n=1 Tax=Frankia nepalensis TaxID=1836974 RepID=A0A937RKW8_9ACTN|nr:glycoside hydrolase family 1 protein [Frankia nepalensis]MBL7498238.1 glycoside hydrolase family 1 protein [Frankia nepalensis]MBL7509534.1 glycoside hydrolase family 1 protein [Frankia nepalensis]MBL7517278.1 glycoside hydrolase family 1 protein [Frankia nepalensis]MBL7632165.1 glycoside hydrolase family 1 protein [Frankia nepalensis]
MSQFPDGFLWGAATAAHQVEGGNVNADLWPSEWAPGSHFAEPSGDAVDHYHRYPEDIATLAGLGLNAYRFGVEWARIEPEEGFFSRAALDHYRRMVGTCLEHGVTPIVTYSHFTTPRWFAAAGGWNGTAAVDRFARYAARVTKHLGDLVPWVCTFNEPNVISLMVHLGVVPAAAREDGLGLSDAADGQRAPSGGQSSSGGSWPVPSVEVMAAAHRKAVEAIKSGPGSPAVGWTLALIDLQPADGGEQRSAAVRQAAELDWLEVSRDDDFVGVQTYTRERIGPDGVLPVPDGAATTQTGWEVYPQALGHTVRLAAEHARVPVLVTENGIATADDDARIAYTAAALEGLAGCVADGVDVRGYLHWSLLDNFEWTSGFAMTFGLIAVDRATFARAVKPSARWLGQVARAGRLS